MTELVTEGRKLVTVRTIDAIDAIEGADQIVAATVDGWQVVVKKGEFEVGQKCVFFEIDSFVPANRKEFAFLAARGTKLDDEGKERCRLRTIKLRGVISQGLALPNFASFENRDNRQCAGLIVKRLNRLNDEKSSRIIIKTRLADDR